MIEYRNWDF